MVNQNTDGQHLHDENTPNHKKYLDFSRLSDVQIISKILGSHTSPSDTNNLAQRLLWDFGGLTGLLNTTVEDIQSKSLLNEAQAHQLIASLELSRRLLMNGVEEKMIVKNAQDAYKLVSDMHHLSREHIRIILLDNHRQVIAIPTIYMGTINAAVIRTAEIYKEAIIRDAPAFILVHNHPHGNAEPSPEDISLTQALADAGKLLDIVFVDHLIIGKSGWTSLKDMSLGFENR